MFLMSVPGGSPPLPIPTTALTNHFRADLGVTDSSGVSAWADQVGSRDLSESTNKPALVASQIDGHASIKFDGTNDRLQDSSGNIAQGFHLFTIIKQLDWSQSDVLIGETTDYFNPGLAQVASSSSGGGSVSPNINIQLSGPPNTALVLDEWHLVGAYFSGSASYLAVDGTETGTGGIDSIFTGGLSLACRGATAFTEVEFAEVAIYSSERTGTALADIEAYFADRYPSISIS
mgnify:FL=1